VRSAFLQTAIVVVLLMSQPLVCSAVCPSALHQTTLAKFVLNQDGRRIAAVAHDGTLFWWDTQTGIRTELMECLKFPRLDPALSFSPDSSLLAVASTSGVLLIDISTGTIRETLSGKCSNAEHIEFSGNSDRLAVSSNEGVCVWQVYDSKQLFFLPGHVERFAFRLDATGQSLIIARDHRVERRNVENNAIITSITLPSDQTAAALALDAYDQTLVAQLRHPLPFRPGDRFSRYQFQFGSWNLQTGKVLKTFGDQTEELASPLQITQRSLVAATYERFYVWDIVEGQLVHSSRDGAVAISGDGRLLAKTHVAVPIRLDLWGAEEPRSKATSFFYRSPECEDVEPEKTRFQSTFAADGRTETGAMVGLHGFVSQDCTPVSYSHAWFDSPEHARQEMQHQVKTATRILEHEPPKDFRAQALLGDRVVTVTPGIEPDESIYSVMWTEEKEFFEVSSISLATALAFEKQTFPKEPRSH
jgi:hypothetical protein